MTNTNVWYDLDPRVLHYRVKFFSPWSMKSANALHFKASPIGDTLSLGFWWQLTSKLDIWKFACMNMAHHKGLVWFDNQLKMMYLSWSLDSFDETEEGNNPGSHQT